MPKIVDWHANKSSTGLQLWATGFFLMNTTIIVYDIKETFLDKKNACLRILDKANIKHNIQVNT